MKKFKFPTNKLNFKKIIIIPYYISLVGNRIINIKNNKNKLSAQENLSGILVTHNIDKNKVYDFTKLLDCYKKLNLTIYKFPETNFGIKYIAIIIDNITLLHENGYYIEISENDITMGEMIEYI